MVFNPIGEEKGEALDLSSIADGLLGIACLKNTTCFISDL